MAGTIARTTSATATVVKPTAKITRPPTGAQLSLRSRSEASYAASSSTGATNSAKASSGGNVNDVSIGRNASTPPPTARNTGYGAPTRRAAAARITAATKRPRSCSSPCMSPNLRHLGPQRPTIFCRCSGYRAPLTEIVAAARSISLRSSGVSCTANAPRFSSSR